MKSFQKLRDFARQGGRSREKQPASDGRASRGGSKYKARGYKGGFSEPAPDAELITHGMQDVRSAQRKYEMLMSLSTEVSSRARGLSTAVHEMASYFAAQGVLDDQFQDVGRVFQHVGRVQDEISKSLELYASHVTQTVTAPTEDLVLDLQKILETKKRYDMKRQSLDSHQMRIIRGRSKTGRGNNQADELLEVVREEFEDIGRLLGEQLFSLQQGRSQKLITQAARHHAAQMKLFSKGLASLHDIEPHIKQVTKELNIDRRLSSSDMDESEAEDGEVASYTEGVDDDDDSYFDNGDEEMQHHHSRDHSREDYRGSGSSENGGNMPFHMSREWSSYMASTSDNTGILRNEGLDSPLPQWVTQGSKSTPASPLPVGGCDSVDETDSFCHHNAMPTNSPAAPRRTTKMGVPMTMYQPFDHSLSVRPLPLPLPVDTPPTMNFEGSSLSSTPRGFVALSAVPSKKRYSYSGPLTSSATPLRSNSSVIPSSGPLLPSSAKSRQLPGSSYGKIHSPISTPTTSPKISPPQIPELHKLPPPPLSASSSPIASLSSGMIPHSAPLHRHEAKHLHTKTWT